MARRELYTRLAAYTAAVASVALAVYFWQGVNKNTQVFLSRPSDIVKALGQWFTVPTFRHSIPITLEEAGVGFAASVFLAVLFASILASSKLLSVMWEPFISAWNSVPKIALAPLFILVFGTGLHSKVYFISFAVFIIPFYALLRSLTAVDPVILNHAKVLGAPHLAQVRDVYLPAIFGSLTASLRVCAQFCLNAAIIAELLGSSSGMGYEIVIAQSQSKANYILSGVLLVALMGFTVDRIMVLIERHFATWRLST